MICRVFRSTQGQMKIYACMAICWQKTRWYQSQYWMGDLHGRQHFIVIQKYDHSWQSLQPRCFAKKVSHCGTLIRIGQDPRRTPRSSATARLPLSHGKCQFECQRTDHAPHEPPAPPGDSASPCRATLPSLSTPLDAETLIPCWMTLAPASLRGTVPSPQRLEPDQPRPVKFMCSVNAFTGRIDAILCADFGNIATF